MTRRLLALVLAVVVGVFGTACDTGEAFEPDAVEVHVCDPWCVHAPTPHPSGKWW